MLKAGCKGLKMAVHEWLVPVLMNHSVVGKSCMEFLCVTVYGIAMVNKE